MQLRIVLVRPRNPLNIGAVARVMANFGFDDLVVVDPHPPVWEEARRAAQGGEQVLASARAVPEIAGAVVGCSSVAGTTSGSRRRLDRAWVAPRELRWRGRLAVLFGPEKTGLSNDHLSYCRHLIRIPTVAAAPSMNLAQAVAVCCYEWSKVRLAERPVPPSGAAAGDLFRLLEIATPLLERAGFFDPRTRAAKLRKLRQIVLKAGLSRAEAALLTGAIHQVSTL